MRAPSRLSAQCSKAPSGQCWSPPGWRPRRRDAWLQKKMLFSLPHPRIRAASEVTAEKLLTRGVRVSTVRLPQVHDARKQGLVTYAIAVAREKGVSAYVGDGLNRWAAAHVLDAARLYRLA